MAGEITYELREDRQAVRIVETGHDPSPFFTLDELLAACQQADAGDEQRSGERWKYAYAYFALAIAQREGL